MMKDLNHVVKHFPNQKLTKTDLSGLEKVETVKFKEINPHYEATSSLKIFRFSCL